MNAKTVVEGAWQAKKSQEGSWLVFDEQLTLQRGDETLELTLVWRHQERSDAVVWQAIDELSSEFYVIYESERAEDVSATNTTLSLPSKLVVSLPYRATLGDHHVRFSGPLSETLDTLRGALDLLSPGEVLEILACLLVLVEVADNRGLSLATVSPQDIYVHENKCLLVNPYQLYAHDSATVVRQDNLVGFSAPECFGINGREIGQYTNTFWLGAMAFYLISGAVPPSCRVSSFAPLLVPRDYQPRFPMGWDEIILKAMDREVSLRHETPRAFYEELVGAHEEIRSRYENLELKSLSIVSQVETHVGYAKAANNRVNQDAVYQAYDPVTGDRLVVVADGVSTASYGSGDIASQLLIAVAKECWLSYVDLSPKPSPQHVVSEIIRRGNNDICDYISHKYGTEIPNFNDSMGTTALVAFFHGQTMTLAAIGDSPAYLITPEHAHCITREHNLFTMSTIGGYPPSELILMPSRQALTQCLGIFEILDGKIVSTEPNFDLYEVPLLPGDKILLTTDGLTDYADPEPNLAIDLITNIIREEDHPGIAALRLIVLANRGGGGDNIGVGVIFVSEEEIGDVDK